MTAVLYKAIEFHRARHCKKMYQDDDEDLDDFAQALNTSSNELLPAGAVMTPKIPPAFDGRTSWFAFEELIDDRDD